MTQEIRRRFTGATPGRSALGVVALLCALGAAAPANAGPPGRWTQVTSEAQPSSTSEVGLERTGDGVLHVLWPRDSGATEEVMHTSIAADARTLSDPHQLISTSHAVNPSVELVAGPGSGIRALFGGIFPGIPDPEGDPGYTGLVTATSTTSGATWSGARAVSNRQTAYIAGGIGAAVAPNGTVISIWGDSSASGAGFHVGLDPTMPDGALSPALCERDPNVAIDSVSGEVVAGWNCVGSDSLQVMRPGAGTIQDAPDSGASMLQQRIGLSGRIGAGGVYAAYGSGTNPFNARPALWRVGAAEANVITQPRDAAHTTLAPAPGGRMWVAWEGSDRGKRIFATRTDANASKFGEIVSIKPPKGTDAIHSLGVEGSAGFLDVLALVKRGPGDIAHWHQRLLPGLTLTAKPGKVGAGKAVTFRVTDAGAPVGKAKVTLKLGKQKITRKTKANGKAKLKIPKATRPGRYTAKASKGGYAAAKRKLRVK